MGIKIDVWGSVLVDKGSHRYLPVILALATVSACPDS
jgi:hypothetical protein